MSDGLAKQANSIRACNADNPALAVKKIWERLEERFGSPEMVERSLKERISSFPRIAGNDNKRLFDLADLVSEIAAVKEQPQYSILFGYFDSSTGINPIASKLPWNLQDKWVTEASRFKSQNGSTFPPFSVFVKFIHDTARTRNDPSFSLTVLRRRTRAQVTAVHQGNCLPWSSRKRKLLQEQQAQKAHYCVHNMEPAIC